MWGVQERQKIRESGPSPMTVPDVAILGDADIFMVQCDIGKPCSECNNRFHQLSGRVCFRYDQKIYEIRRGFDGKPFSLSLIYRTDNL